MMFTSAEGAEKSTGLSHCQLWRQKLALHPIHSIPEEDGLERRFKFVHPSHMDHLAAEALVAELEQVEKGNLNADSYFNKNNIVPRDNLRKLIGEMV